jgi:outer membrane protein assembly factor BamA
MTAALLAVMLSAGPAGGGARDSQAAPGQTAAPQATEVIAEIRVHGNDATPDADILKLAGLTVGAPFGSTTIADVTARLREAHRFEKVEVLKRFASISDPTQIVVIIVVDEGPVSIKIPDDPRGKAQFVRRRGLTNLMFLPILDAEDGYGFTYGVRFALRDVGGKESRLSLPVTWGGSKSVGVEYDKNLSDSFLTRVQVGTGLERRTNPFFGLDDTRQRVWGRVERSAGPLRTGATLGWQHASFGGATDTFRTAGADVAFDTRLDPFLPRNAVFLSAGWERLMFDTRASVTRSRYDARGYLGVIGQTVLVVRVLREDASDPLPDYLKSLLGGSANLRGFKTGTAAGDTLVAGSAELRVPLTSPLGIGKVGVSVFSDVGTAYDHGQSFSTGALKTGIGGSVWFSATVFNLSLSVAHGRGADTRVQVGGGIGF